VNCAAGKTININVVFVKILERQDTLLMSRRFGGMKLKLDWALDEM
jgi:hypothetical protein